jgi:integrase
LNVTMAKPRRPQPEPLPATPPEPPRRVLFALALVRDGLMPATPISRLVRRHFYPIAARARIPTRRQPDGTQGLRLHDLRHGCGTLLVSLGVKPKLVQTILRHSRLATTMDLYVHAYDEDLREAVATLYSALGS